MKISMSYLKNHFGLDIPTDVNQVVERIGAQLGAVEDAVVDLGPIYEPVVVAKVVSCTPIEGSDHLSHCLIDDGSKVKDVARDSDGLVEVVCGASNVAEGLMVAWLPPGSTVPSTVGKENFVLTVRDMLGRASNGMLASGKELAISDSHKGILVIDKDARPGDSFKKLYDLDDQIIDIENKMFTHRPDCFGLVGVARELAGIFNQPFRSPEWYQSDEVTTPSGAVPPIEVINEIADLVPRFCVVVIDGLKVADSPIQIQSYLSRMGIRPVNNIVDATNMSMLLTGQPLHAYDYKKLQSMSKDPAKPRLTIRNPRPSESLELLNSKTVKPSSDSIVITCDDQIIGLGGIMGSLNSEVDQSTETIVLESACFDMYSIRRSSMELGVFSDAVTRFSKGQSPLQNKIVLASTTKIISELIPSGKIASEVVDVNKLSQLEIARNSVHPEITINSSYINDRLGSKLNVDQIAKLLTNVEMEVEVQADELKIKAPFWRTDLEIREDVVEEVGRLFGFDNISPVPIQRSLVPTPKNELLEVKSRVRELLARGGANELLTYSFVSKRIIENASQDTAKAFEIANSLSPELGYYRLSLTPSLLTKVHPNIKLGYDEFTLFELGTRHQADMFSGSDPDEPHEYQSLGIVYAANSSSKDQGAPYYKIKNYLSFLINEFNLKDIKTVPFTDNDVVQGKIWAQVAKPYETSRSAFIVSGDIVVGVIGELKSSVRAKFKLPRRVAALELDTNVFLDATRSQAYSQASKYPSVKQDITLRVPSDSVFDDLNTKLHEKLRALAPASATFDFELFSIFAKDGDPKFKNYSYHLTIADHERTLSDQIVNNLLDELTQYAKSELGSERV
ncbi:MAG TPA: phenylalanine--tRNA ligase subunit beta [Candidatus Saccharimonadales bacterium]